MTPRLSSPARAMAATKSVASKPEVSRSRLPFRSRILNLGPVDGAEGAMALPTPRRMSEGASEV